MVHELNFNKYLELWKESTQLSTSDNQLNNKTFYKSAIYLHPAEMQGFPDPNSQDLNLKIFQAFQIRWSQGPKRNTMWRLSDANMSFTSRFHPSITVQGRSSSPERTTNEQNIQQMWSRNIRVLVRNSKENILNLVHSILGTNGMKFRRLWGFGQKESRK